MDAVKLSHDSAFRLALHGVQAMLRLVRLQSSTPNGDGQSSLSSEVSLNIRKDSVAEALPPSRGNGEGSSNKQLQLPRQRRSSRQLVLDRH